MVGVLNHYRKYPANLPDDKEQVADNYVANLFKDDLIAAVKHVYSDFKRSKTDGDDLLKKMFEQWYGTFDLDFS